MSAEGILLPSENPPASNTSTRYLRIPAASAAKISCPSSVPLLPQDLSHCDIDTHYGIRLRDAFRDTAALERAERFYVLCAIRQASSAIVVESADRDPVLVLHGILVTRLPTSLAHVKFQALMTDMVIELDVDKLKYFCIQVPVGFSFAGQEEKQTGMFVPRFKPYAIKGFLPEELNENGNVKDELRIEGALYTAREEIITSKNFEKQMTVTVSKDSSAVSVAAGIAELGYGTIFILSPNTILMSTVKTVHQGHIDEVLTIAGVKLVTEVSTGALRKHWAHTFPQKKPAKAADEQHQQHQQQHRKSPEHEVLIRRTDANPISEGILRAIGHILGAERVRYGAGSLVAFIHFRKEDEDKAKKLHETTINGCYALTFTAMNGPPM